MLYWFGYSAVQLGVSSSVSDRLARVFRTEVYPRQPEEYRSGCDE